MCLSLVVGAPVGTGTAQAKEFKPGDLLLCNLHHCASISTRAVLPLLSDFYYEAGTPRIAPAAPIGSSTFYLRFKSGYTTGIVAGGHLDRFLSYGVNENRFTRGRWYRAPRCRRNRTQTARRRSAHADTARPQPRRALGLNAQRLLAGFGLVVTAIASSGAMAADPIPTPIGVTKEYHLPPHGSLVATARPVGELRCSSTAVKRFGVHVELFARGLVLLLPAGIGIAPPLVRDGAFVLGGRCSYPLRTREPTGVIEVAPGPTRTVGQLFDVWGQKLSRARIAGFSAPPGKRVLAFVGGKRWTLDPRSIPLRRHSEIVLEVDGYVPPHTSYRFQKGL